MHLPPDRSHISTEQPHPESAQFDQETIARRITMMIEDHRTVTTALEAAAPAIEAFMADLVPRFRRGGRLIYLGAGTSGRLGVLDAAECPPTFQSDPDQVLGIIAGGETALRRSSEGAEDDPDGAHDALTALRLSADDTLLGIAAGGTTPYVLGGIAIAHELGAMTGLLCCSERPSPPGCTHLIVLHTGPEILTGSTRLKAGSATKITLNIITTTLFAELGKIYGRLMVDLRATNDTLFDRAIRVVMTLCPDLDRPAAAALLDRAGRHVKTALVMHRLGCTPAEAQAALDTHAGHLRPLLGPRLDQA